MKERRANEFFNAHGGRPAIIVGNGPSANLIKGISQDDLQKYFCVIGMNRSWKLAQAHHHCIMFHFEHLNDLKDKKFPTRDMTLWTYRDYSELFVREVDDGSVVYIDSVADPRKTDLHEYNIAGLISLDMSECSYADMTGMFALEVALWLGPSPIYLVGYDLFGAHFCDDIGPEDEWQEIQAELFDLTAAQIKKERPWVQIYNCSPESKITGFPKVSFDEVLKWIK